MPIFKSYSPCMLSSESLAMIPLIFLWMKKADKKLLKKISEKNVARNKFVIYCKFTSNDDDNLFMTMTRKQLLHYFRRSFLLAWLNCSSTFTTFYVSDTWSLRWGRINRTKTKTINKYKNHRYFVSRLCVCIRDIELDEFVFIF